MKIKCTCKHAFQDGEYGKGIRVVTPIDKSKHPQTHKIQRVRCTACGKEHDAPNAELRPTDAALSRQVAPRT